MLVIPGICMVLPFKFFKILSSELFALPSIPFVTMSFTRSVIVSAKRLMISSSGSLQKSTSTDTSPIVTEMSQLLLRSVSYEKV